MHLLSAKLILWSDVTEFRQHAGDVPGVSLRTTQSGTDLCGYSELKIIKMRTDISHLRKVVANVGIHWRIKKKLGYGGCGGIST